MVIRTSERSFSPDPRRHGHANEGSNRKLRRKCCTKDATTPAEPNGALFGVCWEPPPSSGRSRKRQRGACRSSSTSSGGVSPSSSSLPALFFRVGCPCRCRRCPPPAASATPPQRHFSASPSTEEPRRLVLCSVVPRPLSRLSACARARGVKDDDTGATRQVARAHHAHGASRHLGATKSLRSTAPTPPPSHPSRSAVPCAA